MSVSLDKYTKGRQQKVFNAKTKIGTPMDFQMIPSLDQSPKPRPTFKIDVRSSV